jgi:chemotaxis protein MotA
MFGTLVGLIQMLSSLEDPTTVGKGLAVALLTTMYGVLVSYLFAQPIAEKLDQKLSADAGNRVLVIECVCMVQQLKNPTEMYDILEAYLPENLRRSVSTGEPSPEKGQK